MLHWQYFQRSDDFDNENIKNQFWDPFWTPKWPPKLLKNLSGGSPRTRPILEPVLRGRPCSSSVSPAECAEPRGRIKRGGVEIRRAVTRQVPFSTPCTPPGEIRALSAVSGGSEGAMRRDTRRTPFFKRAFCVRRAKNQPGDSQGPPRGSPEAAKSLLETAKTSQEGARRQPRGAPRRPLAD